MHQPVLVKEVIDLLAVKPGGTYIDGTVGSGGHAAALLERIGPHGFLLAIDRDADAVERARARLAAWKSQCAIERGNFVDMMKIASGKGIRSVDGVILDLGVSSEQIESVERGFSFMNDGPLDMRMDKSAGRTCRDLVNGLGEDELADVLRTFGEEPRAKRIARAIVRARRTAPIATTLELAGVIEAVAGCRHGRLHPATRAFQALRIMVNEELDFLSKGLVAGLNVLGSGGRLAVISFHSLEDRIVKRLFAEHAGRQVALAAGGSEWRGERPPVRLMTRRPVTPSAAETAGNPRARSAKLRVAERI